MIKIRWKTISATLGHWLKPRVEQLNGRINKMSRRKLIGALLLFWLCGAGFSGWLIVATLFFPRKQHEKTIPAHHWLPHMIGKPGWDLPENDQLFKQDSSYQKK